MTDPIVASPTVRLHGSDTVAKAKRGKAPLPKLTPIQGLKSKTAASEYLSGKQRKELQGRLGEMARARRRAEAESSNLRLS